MSAPLTFAIQPHSVRDGWTMVEVRKPDGALVAAIYVKDSGDGLLITSKYLLGATLDEDMYAPSVVVELEI